MFRTSQAFEETSFHDSWIERVVRNGKVLEIHFGNAWLSSNHPENLYSSHVELRKPCLSFVAVENENALIWHDDKAPLQHPNAEQPIKEVMHATQKADHFHLDGFWQPDDWSEWYIYSREFLLSAGEVVAHES